MNIIKHEQGGFQENRKNNKPSISRGLVSPSAGACANQIQSKQNIKTNIFDFTPLRTLLIVACTANVIW